MNNLFYFLSFTFLILVACKDKDNGPVPTSELEIFINEINPTGDPDWIELYNAGEGTVDLSGFRIWDDEENKYTIPDGIEITAGGFLVFNANDEATGLNTNFKLTSSGETVVIEDAVGEVIDVVDFPALGDGLTYARIPDGATSWATTNNPSLGLANVAPGEAGEPAIFINEFLTINTTCCPDTDGGVEEYDDWIELYNSEESPVNLGGYYLSDDPEDPYKFQFPADDATATTISAGGFLVLWADDSVEQGSLHLNFKLSSTEESIILSNPLGAELDSYTFQTQEEDVSAGRSPDGGSAWTTFAMPTPGTSNN